MESSAPEKIQDPEEDRQQHANEDARHNREIKRAVSALIVNIARQASQAKRKPSAKCEPGAYDDQNNAKNKQQLPNFAQRNGSICVD
jgi:hypothetical protein